MTVAEAPRTLPRGTADAVVHRLFPEPNPYERDPERWALERLGVESWSKPREIRASVLAHRHTAVPACHDSAKTHTAASVACWWIDSHEPGDAFVISSAPSHYQVQALLWSEISQMHEQAELAGYLHGLTGSSIPEWHIGSRRVAYGRKTADEANPQKAMQSFQGKHARHMLVIIDEAGGAPKWLFDAADALATNANARVLAIGNPDDPTSHFAEVCGPGSKWNVIPISAFDTPLYTGEPVSEGLLELLISDVYVEEMRALGEDSHLYQAKVLGRFPDVGNDSLFPPRILLIACENDLPGLDHGGYAVDVARYGTDETCVYRNRGGVIRLARLPDGREAGWRHKDTEETADLVESILGVHGADAIPAYIDAVGVGAGVYDKLRRRGLPVLDFNAGERALEPDRFVNRRAEVFWTLRQRMEDGDVDLDPADKELLSQLGRIRWRPVSGGRVQIESKDEMRKRGVKSPDRADAATMAFAAPSCDWRIDTEPVAEPVLSLTGDLLERAL